MEPALALLPAIVILAAGLAALLAARAAKLSPVVGFLAAGMLIGEHGFKIIEESATTHLLAELGVVFLLFDIGLHFSLKELRAARRDLLGLAPLQLLLAALPMTLIARWAGLDWPVAFAIGAALAISSTAVVARLLAERNIATCPIGRSATAVLVAQDVVAIFLLVFVSSLGGSGASLAVTAGLAALKAAVAVFAALIFGRYLARPIFRALVATRNEETIPAAALLIVLATSAATSALGLSLTLGAFLAGVVVGETPYKHIVQTEMRPFRALLLGFFFMAVGMSLDTGVILASGHWVLVAAALILLIKTGLGAAAARLTGWTDSGAVQFGFIMAQASEFSLVVIAAAAVSAALPSGGAEVLVAAIALTIALTPLWSWTGTRLARRIAARKAAEPAPAATHRQRPVLVFGMTPPGRLAMDALRHHDLSAIAVEADPDRFAQARADGYEVLFGDAGDMRFIEEIGATDVRAIVVGAPRFDVSRDLTPFLRERFPDLVRFVAVADAGELVRHAGLGMRVHLCDDAPPGLALAIDLLGVLGVDPDRIQSWIVQVKEAAAGPEAGLRDGAGERAAA